MRDMLDHNFLFLIPNLNSIFTFLAPSDLRYYVVSINEFRYCRGTQHHVTTGRRKDCPCQTDRDGRASTAGLQLSVSGLRLPPLVSVTLLDGDGPKNLGSSAS